MATAVLDAQGRGFRLHETFIVLGDYEGVYLRVYGATSFEETTLSYWGLGPVYGLKPNGVTSVGMAYPDAWNRATFSLHFEVIPEPSALWLIGTGILALAAKGARLARVVEPDGRMAGGDGNSPPSVGT